jgi:hypothetical protein
LRSQKELSSGNLGWKKKKNKKVSCIFCERTDGQIEKKERKKEKLHNSSSYKGLDSFLLFDFTSTLGLEKLRT